VAASTFSVLMAAQYANGLIDANGADQLEEGCLFWGVIAPQPFLVHFVGHYIDVHHITGDQAEFAGCQELCL
jgi:hypothetical protein